MTCTVQKQAFEDKFDFLILVLGWIGTASDVTHTRTTTTLRVFRLFRAIRAFRLFSAIKIIIDAVVYVTFAGSFQC